MSDGDVKRIVGQLLRQMYHRDAANEFSSLIALICSEENLFASAGEELARLIREGNDQEIRRALDLVSLLRIQVAEDGVKELLESRYGYEVRRRLYASAESPKLEHRLFVKAVAALCILQSETGFRLATEVFRAASGTWMESVLRVVYQGSTDQE